MKLWTANKEAGTRIEPVTSVKEGLKLITEYEEQDKVEGTYQEGFYDVVDEDYCSVSIMDEKIQKMKKLRKNIGWSQAELSNQLNIPRRTIEEWERGSRTPSEWTIDLVIDKLIDIKNNRKTYKDNGLLKSAAMFLSSNSTNPDVYKLLAESPKYKAKYHIGKTFDNGISCIDMELIDGSYLPGVKYVPESEVGNFINNKK